MGWCLFTFTYVAVWGLLFPGDKHSQMTTRNFPYLLHTKLSSGLTPNCWGVIPLRTTFYSRLSVSWTILGYNTLGTAKLRFVAFATAETAWVKSSTLLPQRPLTRQAARARMKQDRQLLLWFSPGLWQRYVPYSSLAVLRVLPTSLPVCILALPLF